MIGQRASQLDLLGAEHAARTVGDAKGTDDAVADRQRDREPGPIARALDTGPRLDREPDTRIREEIRRRDRLARQRGKSDEAHPGRKDQRFPRLLAELS